MQTTSTRLAPRGELARFVRFLQLTTRAPDAAPYVRLPDGEVDLVVRWSARGGDGHVVGPRLRVLQKPSAELPRAIAVRFKPGGAYPFFGVPMSELAGRILSIETLWRGEGARLRDALAEAPTPAARLALLEDTLAARLRSSDVFEPASTHTVRRALRMMEAARELPSVDGLARALGVSARQLRRAFDDVVGVGPKAFARIVRFQRAVRAAEGATAPDWGAIAADVGYYDQSHLISDFRALAGVTPGALARLRAAAPPG